MKITNKLSIFRFICAILIASLFTWWLKSKSKSIWIAITWIFVAGCISDFLDGYIARKKGMVTTFGKIIDPIADKALINISLIVILVFISLWRVRVITQVIFLSVTLMLLRDIIVDAAKISLASSKRKDVAATKLGKAKTILQMTVILVTFAALSYDQVIKIKVVHLTWVFIVTTIVSLASGYHYIMLAWRTKK